MKKKQSGLREGSSYGTGEILVIAVGDSGGLIISVVRD